MATLMSTHDEALHELAMDDLAELVSPGDEGRVPERFRGEVLARHASTPVAKQSYPKYELTDERIDIIRAQWNGTTRRMREIGEQIGVPWYTVRDWGQDKLQLPNPSSAQPNGMGSRATRDKPKATKATDDAPAHTDTDGERVAPKAKGKIPWSAAPDEAEQSEIDAQRAKRNAMIAAAGPDDVIPADSATGWLTPKWTYTDELGAVIVEHWDGTQNNLAHLAERERIPLGVLRSWIDTHHLTPKAAPGGADAPRQASRPIPKPISTLATELPPVAPRPLPPVTPLPPKPATESSDRRLERFTAWIDGAVGGKTSVFLVPASEVVVLRGADGYRVLTPRGDWPDEPISRKLVERIVRLLASGASDAAVYGVVYQAAVYGVVYQAEAYGVVYQAEAYGVVYQAEA